MKQFAEPEIQCLSLERVILDCKLCSDDKVEDFLAELPDPPDIRVLRTSVNNLIDLGALNTDESLTVLGRKISYLSLPPVLAKTLLYSSVFGQVHFFFSYFHYYLFLLIYSIILSK